jgi:hypothetical protein
LRIEIFASPPSVVMGTPYTRIPSTRPKMRSFFARQFC